MTIPAAEDDNQVRVAMERAGRSLPEGPSGGTVFLEDRTDVRVLLASGEPPEVAVTRSRGAAAGDCESIHLTDPDLDELAAIARGGRAGATGGPKTLRPGAVQAVTQVDSGWILAAASTLAERVHRATSGISEVHWSASLVAFSQNVWVASHGLPLQRDLRRGCRAELRIRIGCHPKTATIDEAVIGWGSPAVPEGLIDRTLMLADRKRGVRPAPRRGTVSAVLAPGVGGVAIHELVGHALEGDVVLRRQTWLQRGTLPTPARRFDVIDDPRRGRGAWRVDDEGEPSVETVLVDSGSVSGLLLDRGTAAMLGRRTTGHGRRSSYLTATRPRMGCTFIPPGEDDPGEVIRETRLGVFIRRVTAGHTDPFLGRASFVVTEADEIVDGVIGAPLEPFVVELDGPETWGSIDRVGHDLAFDTCVGSCVRDGQPLAVSVGAPTIRIGVMRVIS